MVNFGEALRKGMGFAAEPKRWLPLFVLDAIVLLVFIYGFLAGAPEFFDLMASSGSDPLFGAQVATLVGNFILVGIVWYVLRLWLLGALVHQSAKPREYEKSFKVSFNNIHKIIVATAVVAIITTIVGAIPVIGWLFSILLSIAFFFILQGIILDRLGVASTLKTSWKIFRKDPFDVFISWFLISVVSSLIMLIFALPLLFYVGEFFFSAAIAGTFETGGSAMVLAYFQENMAMITVLGLIALVGMEAGQAFAARAQTEFYLQLKKRFPSILKEFSRKLGRFF